MNNLLSEFTLVGNFIVSDKDSNMLHFNYLVKGKFLTKDEGRVYMIVEEKNGNSKILKVGKSSAKKGASSTISGYYNALRGTPSQNRYCMHEMILEKLRNGYTIKFYVKYAESVKMKIKGFFSEEEIMVPIDMTYLERLYIEDYKKIYGSFPEWNFQESGGNLPIDLVENFGKFIINKKTKK